MQKRLNKHLKLDTTMRMNTTQDLMCQLMAVVLLTFSAEKKKASACFVIY